MREQVHKMLTDVPPQEVVPDGALEGVTSVQHEGVGLGLLRLFDSCVEPSIASDAGRF